LDNARQLYAQSLDITRDIGDRRVMAWVLSNFGDLERTAGDDGSALAHYEACLMEFVTLRDGMGAGRAFADIGDVARDQGDLAKARASYGESIKIFRDIGDRRGIARLLGRFAVVAADTGDVERGWKLAAAASRMYERLQTAGDDAHEVIATLRNAGPLDDRQLQPWWSAGQRMSIAESVTLALSPPTVADDVDGDIGTR